ncbi:hypothetical protein Tco_0603765 [Tanacetum coccineum]
MRSSRIIDFGVAVQILERVMCILWLSGLYTSKTALMRASKKFESTKKRNCCKDFSNLEGVESYVKIVLAEIDQIENL